MSSTRRTDARSRAAVTVASVLSALATAGPLVIPLTAQDARDGLAAATRARAEEPARAAASFGRGALGAGVLARVDVPFVPQGELLCGGAAAAMVMRYHGERGASAESFTHLVRRDEGGIRTDELTAELAARGWDVEVRVNDLPGLEAALAADLPPIVLLQSARGRWHYLVVVGLEPAGGPGARTVIVHDPAQAPAVRIGEDDFLRRWEVGGRWMLLVRPGRSRTPAPAAPAVSAPVLAAEEAAASADLVRASARFRARDWRGAASAAGAAARSAPQDPRAWRLLGGALYLDGRPDDALDAWARIGEPRIDGVEVHGLERTRHPVVHALLDLHPGGPLERARLERARRRAALLPTATLARVRYAAESGGWAEVEAVVLEGPAHPLSRRGLLAAAAAAAAGEVTAWASGLAGAGERLGVRWRPGADGGVRVELAAPHALGLPGRTEAGVARTDDSGHLAAWLRATDWLSGRLRWEAGVRADRGADAAARPALTAALHAAGRALHARVGGAAWLAGDAAALGALDLAAGLGSPERGWTGVAHAGARATTAAAPLELRPGAGSDGRRPLAGPFSGADPRPLLRAHPAVLGDRLVHGSVEGALWGGPIEGLGLAAFADGALVRTAGGNEGFADLGLGARATLADLPGVLRLDHAWSLTDGARRWSVGWQLGPGVGLAP